MFFTLFIVFIVMCILEQEGYFIPPEPEKVTVRFYESVLVDGEVITDKEIFPSLDNPIGFDRLLIDNVYKHQTINNGLLLPSSKAPDTSVVNGNTYQSRSLVAGETRPFHYFLGSLVSNYYVYSPTDGSINQEPKAFSVVMSEPTGRIQTRAIYVKKSIEE